MISRSNRGVAAFLMIIGSVFLALQGCFVHKMSSIIDTRTWLFARFFVGWTLISCYLVFLHRPKTLIYKYIPIHSWKLSLLSGVLGCVAIGCYFWSLQYLPPSVATVLLLSFPVAWPSAVQLIAACKNSCSVLWGILILCIGVAFLMVSNVYWAILMALASGIVLSLLMVTLKTLAARDSLLNITLHYFFIAAVGAGLFWLMGAHVALTTFTPLIYYYLIGAGVIAVLCQLFFTLAIRYASPRVVTPYIYSSLLFTVLLDKWYIKMSLVRWDMLGILLVITGGIWVMRTIFKGARGNL